MSGHNMEIISRINKIGTLYVNPKNCKMVLKTKTATILDQTKIQELVLHERIPLTAQLEITEKCNFDCYYCYARSLKGRKDLELNDLKNIIDKLSQNGIVFIELTGGEPLARKDIIELIKYINSKNMIISIITNGSLVNQELINELKNGFIRNITVSLLAPVKEVCDNLTGLKNSYDLTLRGIKLLQQNNMPVTITSTITNKNIDYYDEYKKLEEQLDIKIQYPIDVIPTFNGYDEVEGYAIEHCEHNQLRKLRQYINNSQQYSNETGKLSCTAFKTKFCVTNLGDVLPCLKYRKVVGNLKEQSFSEIWNNKYMKDNMGKIFCRSDKCQQCNNKKFCLYCPAFSGVVDKNGNDIQCEKASLICRVITQEV